MLSNKVKTPNKTSQANVEAKKGFRITPFRATIALILAGIISTGIFMADKVSSSQEKEVPTNPSDGGEGGDGDDPKKKPKAREKKNRPEGDSGLVLCDLDDFHPDDVMEKAQKIRLGRYKEAALYFIKRVGIDKPNDKKKIMEIFSGGCTKYGGYGEEDRDHHFTSPEGGIQKCSDWVKLEGNYKIPEDLIPENEENKHDHLLTNRERKWKKMVKEGNAKKVLDEFDFDQLYFSEDSKVNEKAISTVKKNFEQAMERVSKTQDAEKKGEIVCRFIESLFEYEDSFDEPHDDEEDEDATKEYVPARSNLLFIILEQALGKLGDVAGKNDCDELYKDLLSDHSGVNFFN